MIDVDWSKQHCGVHHGSFEDVLTLMPDLKELMYTFPDNPELFSFDVKVHMLFPNQFPCMPNWHYDNVPRVNGIQRLDLVRPEFPMYLWISGPPLTQFAHGFVLPRVWVRFNQLDSHRGTASGDFCWRGFVRASHRDLIPVKDGDKLRRHCQVYLDSETYQW